MRLTDLYPEWIRWEDVVMEVGLPTDNPEPIRHTYVHQCVNLSHAQGIEFDCPKCQDPGKSHRIQVAFHGRGVLDHHGSRGHDGGPTRWHISGGETFSDLSLTPSIDCTRSNPNCWHGFITNGEAT